MLTEGELLRVEVLLERDVVVVLREDVLGVELVVDLTLRDELDTVAESAGVAAE